MSAQTSKCQQTADSPRLVLSCAQMSRAFNVNGNSLPAKLQPWTDTPGKPYSQAELVCCLLHGDATVLQFFMCSEAPGPEPAQTHSKIWALSVGKHKMQRITLCDDPLLTQDSPHPGSELYRNHSFFLAGRMATQHGMDKQKGESLAA